MHVPTRQTGLTLIGLLVILGFVALMAMVVLKLVPVYLEAFAVEKAVESVQAEASARTPQEIKDTLVNRFDINNIETVTHKDIKIERNREKYIVRVDYEVRVPLLYNIDMLLTFKNLAEVPAR